MSNIKKTIYIISAVCLVFMFAFYKLFVDKRNDVCLFIGILFMTAAYHMIIRLVIGTFGDAALEKGIDPDNHWFADSNTEQAIYRAIGVRSWKNRLPAPDVWKFSLKRRSLEDIIAESCRTEVVHEAGAIASLLSVLLTVPFGYLWFFIVTAVLGGIFDLAFVIVQRYNRPRLMRTAAKKRMLFFEKLEYDNAFAEFEGADNDSADDEAAENEGADNDAAGNKAADNETADNEAEPQGSVQDPRDLKELQDPEKKEDPIIPDDPEENKK